MTRATPIVRSGNAGEISELLSARTDWDRYPASYRTLKNLIPVPQGPILRRSGTQYLAACLDGRESVLVSFIFSDSQSYVIEFSELKLRIFNEDGPLAGVLHIVTGLSRETSDSPLLFSLCASTIPSARPTDEAAGGWDSTQLAVGDYVFLGAFPERFGGLNGQIGKITAVKTNQVQVDEISCDCPDSVLQAGLEDSAGEFPYLRKIYTITSPYSLEEARSLQCTQQLDVLFLFCGQKPPHRLERRAEKHWTLVESELSDGPYLDLPDPRGSISLTATGKPLTSSDQVVITNDKRLADVIADKGTRYIKSGSKNEVSNLIFDLGAIRAYAGAGNAIIDDNLDTSWYKRGSRSSRLYLFIKRTFVCTGYLIYAPRDELQRGPASWDLRGGKIVSRQGDSNRWELTWGWLDGQRGYSGYRNGRSHLFTLASRQAYSVFKFDCTPTSAQDSIEIAEFVLLGYYEGNEANVATTLSLTFSELSGINHGKGLSGQDVGRAIRLKSPSDGVWRHSVIQTCPSTVTATVRLEGLPFPDRVDVLDWRLGAFSNGLGWPVDGIFYRDRLILAGSRTCPNLIAGSVANDFLSFTPTSLNGEVLATHAFTVRLLSKRQVRIRNIESDRHGVIVGCDTGVWVLTTQDSNQGMGPLNVRADPVTSAGVSPAAPLSVGRQVLFITRSRRSVHEVSYLFELDGYKSIDLSAFSSHLSQSRFLEIVYTDDPYPVVWVKRADGVLVGMTYDKEQAVIGWHRHDVGGAVSSLCVIPQASTGTDALWMVVSRGRGESRRRSIERLMPTWDFGASLRGEVDGSRLKAYAHFVDSGLLCETLSQLRARQAEFPPQRSTAPEWNTWRNGVTRIPFGMLSVSSTPQTTLSGLWHLEGQEVVGLGDGNPLPPQTVRNGKVTYEGSYRRVVAGLAYESLGETSRLDVGGVHGTSQSLTKRIHGASLLLWESTKGEIGSYSNGVVAWDAIEYPIERVTLDGVSQLKLYTGFVGLQRVNCDYNQEGILGFRQTRALPFNVLGLIPRLYTQNG